MSQTLPQNPQYLILLGHKGGVQSPVTQDRFINTLEAMKKWPQAQLIITGNEDKGEISAYRAMLEKAGVSSFLTEAQSKTTWGNFKNILPLLKSKNDAVVIVTSEYHQRRSLLIARSYGLNAHAFGKDRQTYGNAQKLFLKERFALLYSVPKALWNRITLK
jgi:uncharacterized SAM-binding protein YcdF (DUF218 family)